MRGLRGLRGPLADRRLENGLRLECHQVFLSLPARLAGAIADELVDIVLVQVGRQEGGDRETDSTLG